MPPLTTRYVLLSLASGAVWGLIGYMPGASTFGSAIWGAVLVSPAIGVVVGLSFRWIEVVLQAVPAVLWGLTFTGYFLFLWPLAYLNHCLLAPEL